MQRLKEERRKKTRWKSPNTTTHCVRMSNISWRKMQTINQIVSVKITCSKQFPLVVSSSKAQTKKRYLWKKIEFSWLYWNDFNFKSHYFSQGKPQSFWWNRIKYSSVAFKLSPFETHIPHVILDIYIFFFFKLQESFFLSQTSFFSPPLFMKCKQHSFSSICLMYTFIDVFESIHSYLLICIN